jgi:serine/threonine protein kinase
LNVPAEIPEAAPRLIADRYRVERVLGEGSSARTLLCRDLQNDSLVAVKELHFARLGDWKFLELFQREARMLSMLEHSGIPRVFDYFEGSGDSASFYIVQEFIEGPSLQQRMDSGPMLGQKEIHDLALGLLDVLDYLHGRAPPVIHRDIKPANILLRADGMPALVDFGGVSMGWQPPGASGATVVGTVGYMPPEQFVGQAGVGSDLYSLGATLLHLITGRPPGDFPFDSGRIEVPANLTAESSLGRMIEALLQPAPRDRPRTAEAARSILLGTDSDRPRTGTTLLPARRIKMPVPAAAPLEHSIMGVSGEPRFVDMGDPPRDPGGEFRDVYRNLMHPLFPARRPWSDAVHALWLGFTGAAAVATLGGVPALLAWGVRKRKRLYDDLFRHGSFAPGIIRSMVETGGFYVTVKYEFEVAGAGYVGYAQCAQEVNRYWSTDDVVAVLYDAEDPNRSCIVYR